GKVTVVFDNQAAVMAIGARKSGPGHWIWDKWHALAEEVMRRHPGAKLTIRWAPGHRDIPGNERADVEAKRAAQDRLSSSRDLAPTLQRPLPFSKSAVRQAYNGELKAIVLDKWKRSRRYERTAQYDRRLHKGSYLALTEKLPRSLVVLLLQLRPGHCPLSKHLHRINKADSPICPCCRQADESVAHYLLHC
ncbi:hypothetical protein FB45DRAFT_685174, partial [Roridomyces roridus]